MRLALPKKHAARGSFETALRVVSILMNSLIKLGPNEFINQKKFQSMNSFINLWPKYSDKFFASLMATKQNRRKIITHQHGNKK